jgi:multicomponent Na+:H+ antiporter subunit C
MELIDFIVARFNYWIYIILMMLGLFAMITKNNLVKKLIGMSIFQTGIILFYVSIGVKEGATIPILSHDTLHPPIHADAGELSVAHGTYDEAADVAQPGGETHGSSGAIDVAEYANPLPHVLMLTAIVVGVATLGVALAIVQKIHREYQSLEESEILEKIHLGHG